MRGWRVGEGPRRVHLGATHTCEGHHIGAQRGCGVQLKGFEATIANGHQQVPPVWSHCQPGGSSTKSMAGMGGTGGTGGTGAMGVMMVQQGRKYTQHSTAC